MSRSRLQQSPSEAVKITGQLHSSIEARKVARALIALSKLNIKYEQVVDLLEATDPRVYTSTYKNWPSIYFKHRPIIVFYQSQLVCRLSPLAIVTAQAQFSMHPWRTTYGGPGHQGWYVLSPRLDNDWPTFALLALGEAQADAPEPAPAHA